METKEQLLQELESLKKRIENLDKPKFEKGWYKIKDSDKFLIYIISIYDEYVKGYGFGRCGNWLEESTFCNNNEYIQQGFNYFIPATPSEVESALIKEAERRGFKEGVVYKTAWGHEAICIYHNVLKYDSKLNCLSGSNGNNCIFQNGQWATIIKDEPIKIGGYEVKRNNLGSFDIGCKKNISNGKVRVLRRLMIQCDFKTVAFDGMEVTLDTINKMLDK